MEKWYIKTRLNKNKSFMLCLTAFGMLSLFIEFYYSYIEFASRNGSVRAIQTSRSKLPREVNGETALHNTSDFQVVHDIQNSPSKLPREVNGETALHNTSDFQVVHDIQTSPSKLPREVNGETENSLSKLPREVNGETTLHNTSDFQVVHDIQNSPSKLPREVNGETTLHNTSDFQVVHDIQNSPNKLPREVNGETTFHNTSDFQVVHDIQTSTRKLPREVNGETTLHNNSDFQVVHEGGNIFVYSAYFNDVTKPFVVTVIGVGVLKKMPHKVTCRYNGSVLMNEKNNSFSRNATLETTGEVYVMPESHGYWYGAVFIHCKLPTNQTHPSHVMILEDSYKPPLSNLPVMFPNKRQGNSLWKMTMCFSPLFGDKWQQMVETFEFARMLGADHAVVYVLNAGVKVLRVLQLYKNTGFLEIHSWRHPPKPVHYNGQMAAINDCLLRMRHVSDLVVFMDLDEMIVPRSYNTWSGVLQYVRQQKRKNSSHIAAFLFRSAFFYTQPIHANQTPTAQTEIAQNPNLNSQTNLMDEQFKLASSLNMQTVLRQYRDVEIFTAAVRGKNIVDPLKVLTMGIHFVHTFKPGYRSVVVNTDVALLHHYRSDGKVMMTVRDATAFRFVPELIARIQNKKKEL